MLSDFDGVELYILESNGIGDRVTLGVKLYILNNEPDDRMFWSSQFVLLFLHKNIWTLTSGR